MAATLQPADTLLLAHCSACGAFSFPAQVPGCRVCGAPPAHLRAVPAPGTPRLDNAITLHAELAPGLAVPCVVGEVRLAPGVVEEALIDDADEAALAPGSALRLQRRGEDDAARWVFVPVADADAMSASAGSASERPAIATATAAATEQTTTPAPSPMSSSASSTAPSPEPASARAPRAGTRPPQGATLASLLQQRPVYVVGIGMHRYQFPTETSYVQLGLTAVRHALADAGVAWAQVPSAVVGSAALGMAAGRVMLRHLGSTGVEVQQVENASASGSTAFRLACLQVAAGLHELVLAVGVDKFGDGRRAVLKDGLPPLSPTANIPLVKFALLARRMMREHGWTAQDLAAVAVKNHGNAALNPYAQFRKPRTIEQVLNSPLIAGDLTGLQCTPRGEGAAAVIVAGEEAMQRFQLDRGRAVRVLSSVATSERLADDAPDGVPPIVEMVRASATAALDAAGVAAGELDLVELHDAFSVEELVYAEAIGVCAPGQAAQASLRGEFAIGGRCAVNASGGLIGMGHPLGPTGIGQIAELTRQLRGEAEGRQHPGARLGLAHMIGLGSVAVAHVLQKT